MKKDIDLNERVKREAGDYSIVINNRKFFCEVFEYTNAFIKEDIVGQKIKEVMSHTCDKRVLEIGSTIWHEWIEKNGYKANKIDAINITNEEIEKGLKLSRGSINKPFFHIMDAHRLEYDDGVFDMVIGQGILHHLELRIVMKEIKRVLKPGGCMVFLEPLNINPLGKLFRILTPKLRTIDEEAFGFKHLNIIKEFNQNVELYPSQLTIVPFGVISKYISSDPKNLLTLSGYKLDDLLYKYFPIIKYLYRRMLIVGYK